MRSKNHPPPAARISKNGATPIGMTPFYIVDANQLAGASVGASVVSSTTFRQSLLT